MRFLAWNSQVISLESALLFPIDKAAGRPIAGRSRADLLGSNSLIMFTVEGIRVMHDVGCVGYAHKSVLNFVTQEYISLSLLID